MTVTATGPLVDELLGTKTPTPDPTAEYAAKVDEMLAQLEAGGPTGTAYRRAIAASKEHFDAETAEHQMTVAHDASPEAPYRHLRFTAPGSLYNFEVVTWPGHLHVGGQIESVTFARLHDMMDFFRGGGINPDYWGQKVVAGKVRGFSRDVFTQSVLKELLTTLAGYSEADQQVIKAEAYLDLLSNDPGSTAFAQELLSNFTVDLPSGRTYDFGPDWWEIPIEGYDHHFLMACHAVKHAVDTYLTAHPGNVIPEVA